MHSKPKFSLLATCLPALLLVPASAWGQDGFSVQNFAPAADRDNAYITAPTASISPHRSWSASFFLHYARNPLVQTDANGNRERVVVGDQLASDVMASVSLWDRLELGFALPLFWYQTGEAIEALPEATASDSRVRPGDLRLSARVGLLGPDEGNGGPALALGVWGILPTGNGDAYQGGELAVIPRVMFDWVFGSGARIGTSAGYRIGPEAQLENIQRNDEVNLTLAGLVPVGATRQWDLLAEVQGNVAVGAGGVENVNSPVEGRLGARVRAADLVRVEFGVGTGIVSGAGAPDYRAYAALALGSPRDPDGDGLIGSADQCPREPEDFDGFEDEDGCPDPDNDGDGVLDVADDCPNDPEDRDGFEDEDGCPDPDNDGDGILDIHDQCPNDPEDFDGFEDEDGCPDPDNDGDGIPDTEDMCPMEPEDLDGFEDEDGCPDPDNDGDGILDVDDACPNDAEDFDGFEDEDGCPEEGAGMVAITCEAIDIAESVFFDTDSDVIQARSYPLLDQVAGVLRSVRHIRMVRVEGHTDNRGRADYNLDLSRRRAASVVRYLVERGIEPARLTSEGFGPNQPIADNRTAQGRATNRRVVFVIVEQDSTCTR
jgi:outer membrane protein OmpA-like peptidoglycan-associated protein